RVDLAVRNLGIGKASSFNHCESRFTGQEQISENHSFKAELAVWIAGGNSLFQEPRVLLVPAHPQHHAVTRLAHDGGLRVSQPSAELVAGQTSGDGGEVLHWGVDNLGVGVVRDHRIRVIKKLDEVWQPYPRIFGRRRSCDDVFICVGTHSPGKTPSEIILTRP